MQCICDIAGSTPSAIANFIKAQQAHQREAAQVSESEQSCSLITFDDDKWDRLEELGLMLCCLCLDLGGLLPYPPPDTLAASAFAAKLVIPSVPAADVLLVLSDTFLSIAAELSFPCPLPAALLVAGLLCTGDQSLPLEAG